MSMLDRPSRTLAYLLDPSAPTEPLRSSAGLKRQTTEPNHLRAELLRSPLDPCIHLSGLYVHPQTEASTHRTTPSFESERHLDPSVIWTRASFGQERHKTAALSNIQVPEFSKRFRTHLLSFLKIL